MSRIMIVDDSPEQVEILTSFLKSPEDEVTGFCDPFRALSEAMDNPPDVVIVDQMMPLMEGTKLIKEMKKAGILAKFVLISGLIPDGDFTSTQNGVADRCFGKPLLREALIREMRSLV